MSQADHVNDLFLPEVIKLRQQWFIIVSHVMSSKAVDPVCGREAVPMTVTIFNLCQLNQNRPYATASSNDQQGLTFPAPSWILWR